MLVISDKPALLYCIVFQRRGHTLLLLLGYLLKRSEGKRHVCVCRTMHMAEMFLFHTTTSNRRRSCP